MEGGLESAFGLGLGLESGLKLINVQLINGAYVKDPWLVRVRVRVVGRIMG